MAKAISVARNMATIGQVQARYTRLIPEEFPYGNLFGVGNNVGLGVTPVGYRFTQVPVVNVQWREVATGWQHTLAIDDHKRLWAWGDNSNGQLGLGDTVTRTTPTLVDDTRNWRRVAASYKNASIALDEDGNVFVAGFILPTPYGSTFKHLAGYTFTEIAAGKGDYSHAVAIDPNGYLYTWGSNYGSLGNGSYSGDVSYPTRIGTPAQVSSGLYAEEIVGVKKISAGYANTGYIDSYNRLYFTGRDVYGAIGGGSTKFTLRRTNMLDVSLGYYHTLGINTVQQMLGRGYDYFDLLPGCPSDGAQNNPWYVMSTKTATSISAASRNTFAVLDGDPYICG